MRDEIQPGERVGNQKIPPGTGKIGGEPLGYDRDDQQ